MDKRENSYTTIDEYILFFPKEIQEKLRQLRETIRKAAPGAEERISYQMPAYRFKGNLVYFAAAKNHLGFYPTGVTEKFKKELAGYKTGKGSIQFPLDQPLPLDLITKIVKFRVSENIRKEKRENK